MESVKAASYDELLARLRPWQQEHLLRFWDELTADERNRLAEQIQAIDIELLMRHRPQSGATPAESAAQRAMRAESPPAIKIEASDNRFSPSQARARGEAALRAGEIGMVLVAGGQGTRLGFDHPKGLFPIGPVSGRTLFEVLVDRLKAVRERYRSPIPLLIMTSSATHGETVDYFETHDYLGLPREEVVFFQQGTMPAVDAESWRLLLAGKGELALAPDGHGGMLAALARRVGFAWLRERGIGTLFYGQIDNPLLTVCDPTFLGYHLLAESELTTQVVRKHDPAERVGVVGMVDGRLEIFEYSDLTPEQAGRRAADGTLVLWAGNTAVHVLDVAFLERVSNLADGLPLHLAHKKVPHINEQGERIEPQEPNAIKFERFIFDLMPQANNALVVEVDRACAFAPVKNADGAPSDTPATAQAAMVALDRSWLEAAGAIVDPNVKVEIHPQWAWEADDVRQRIQPGTKIDKDQYFK